MISNTDRNRQMKMTNGNRTRTSIQAMSQNLENKHWQHKVNDIQCMVNDIKPVTRINFVSELILSQNSFCLRIHVVSFRGTHLKITPPISTIPSEKSKPLTGSPDMFTKTIPMKILIQKLRFSMMEEPVTNDSEIKAKQVAAATNRSLKEAKKEKKEVLEANRDIVDEALKENREAVKIMADNVKALSPEIANSNNNQLRDTMNHFASVMLPLCHISGSVDVTSGALQVLTTMIEYYKAFQRLQEI